MQIPRSKKSFEEISAECAHDQAFGTFMTVTIRKNDYRD